MLHSRWCPSVNPKPSPSPSPSPSPHPAPSPSPSACAFASVSASATSAATATSAIAATTAMAAATATTDRCVIHYVDMAVGQNGADVFLLTTGQTHAGNFSYQCGGEGTAVRIRTSEPGRFHDGSQNCCAPCVTAVSCKK